MRRAVRELEAVVRVLRSSHVYATAPVGPPQPAYLNAAVLVDWEGTAQALLDALLGIEKGLGRTRDGERFGPRTIDLDVLWIEGLAIATPTLTVPHPRLEERAFALVPLLEVAADAANPSTGARYVAPAGDVRRTDDRL
jgi:2-amino-4-hydroxy-6-hydroxymethyldihydropteridine diphosphokinase